jgi:predicted nucleotidyltransferase
MNIHEDFEEFLRFLNEEKVEFVVVGGYAVAFHGYVRATNDMDLFFKNTKDNILKICRALGNFGIPTRGEHKKEFADPGSIIRVGVHPVRLEMINLISGVSFEKVWQSRVKGVYGDVPVNYISFKDLIKNKKASGRPKDLADVDELGGNRIS